MTAAPAGAPGCVPAATAVGRPDTRLVVIRGNSASGKSSVAQGLRDHYGRGVAIVGQDVIRRNVLREHGTMGGANIALLGRIARDALDAGFHVVLEGILYADRYSHMITSLVRDHRGVSRCYYLDVPLEATLARHASKADAAYLEHVTDTHLTTWYRQLDLLPGGLESVIPADSSLQDDGPAPVPARFPRAASATSRRSRPKQGSPGRAFYPKKNRDGSPRPGPYQHLAEESNAGLPSSGSRESFQTRGPRRSNASKSRSAGSGNASPYAT